eukprot:scaffold66748_cov18-Tisochrysis_lutea.AAC.1
MPCAQGFKHAIPYAGSGDQSRGSPAPGWPLIPCLGGLHLRVQKMQGRNRWVGQRRLDFRSAV